jgi:ParB family chromosome partitioning protein
MNLESGVLQVHIEDIIPNRFQPRLNFDEQGLKELADSIREHGIIQPLVLRKLGEKYEIIAGERRYKAAQLVGLTTVPAVIANIDDNKSAEVALVENVQRRDLTAIEEARSYKNLLDKGYLTQEQLAKRMGLSQPAVANKLRLLNLDEEVQQALLEERISERHARTLLSLNDKAAQREWLHRVINERLTVRQLDIELKKLKPVDETPVSESDEGGDIPLVSAIPSIEDIKANAIDFREANRLGSQPAVQQSVEEIESLDVLEESTQEVETLDVLEDPQPSPFNTPLSEDSFTAATSIPEFNIATPNSSSTLYPNESFDTFNSSNDNKFFSMDPVKDEPIPSAKDFFNPTNNMTTKNGNMEVFDAEPNRSEFINDFNMSAPVVEDDKPTPAQPMDFNNDYNNFNDIEINSHNKFFTPIQDNSTIPVIETKLNNDVDPMAAVDNLVNTSQSQKVSGMQLKDAIATVRSCIEGLGASGFYIDVEEIDFDSNYQITMRIHKDN